MIYANDVVQSFVNAMIDAGVSPQDPSVVVPDGRLHRYRVEGDRAGTKNGFFVLFLDETPAGAFGSWRTGVRGKWRADDKSNLTVADREREREKIEAKRDFERQRLIEGQTAAARRARAYFERSFPADPLHPYLQRKRVPPLSARQRADKLVLPIFDLQSRELISLQHIAPDGSKRFTAGCRKHGGVIPVAGQVPNASRILIAEGWATGASLSAMEPDALVLAALDAGNLHPVAMTVRTRWPSAEIVIAADADRVGIEKAYSAAIRAQALVAIPEFPPGVEGSDWNDYVATGLGGG